MSPSMSPSPGRYQLTRRLSELAPVREHFAEELREQPKALLKELPKELPMEMPKEQSKVQPSASPLPTPTTNTDSRTSYETLLEQIASQRAKLHVLEAGTEALTKDIAVLDETLDEEQESMDQIMTTTQRAVHGWEGVWSDYAKCEPIEALQTRPSTLADLIRGMNWQDKKTLFEAMVEACQPRETFQLQNLITVHHGPVHGFDLLQELPNNVSKLVMQHLPFSELASCRMVSKSWKQKATTYEVVTSALSRLTQSEDSFPVEQKDHSTSNWNQLCRFHERDLRWRRGKPASIHTMLGHSTYVTSVKDRGEWIVSGGYDEKVRLWESSTGKCVKIWEVGSAVSCVELFVDPCMEGGGVVVAAFVDIGLLKVWSLHGPVNMHTLTGHQKGVRALAISDRYLVTAGFDQTVLVWNWNTGRKIASFRAHNEVILSVHLTKNTVYSFCIDATLRAFDIPSRTLLHQVKLLDLQPNSTLQWSCLQDNMFLTATNKKVYVWHMEHLESLVLQQNQQQQQAFHHQISRPKSAMSASSESSNHSGSNNSQDSCDRLSPPQTPAASTSSTSINTMTSGPETPALSIAASSSCSSTGSSYFYPSVSTSPLPLLLSTEPSSPGSFDSLETRVQPRLTAVLNMNMDMWCGNVTRHDPPLLVLGSRSSTTKLVTMSLTKDIIDPNKDYEANYVPLQVFPKPAPVQGMPGGHGRGIMCIDTDSSKLVVGCTGGAIHVMNMDPSMRALQPLRASQAQVAIVTLPHLTPVPTESVRSVSPIQPPLPLAIATSPDSSLIHAPGTTISCISPTSASPHSATSVFPRRPPPALRSNATNVAARFSLPSPDQSPMTPTIPLILSATTIPVGEPVNPCPRGTTKPSLPMGSSDLRPYEDHQEVLVTDEDDEDAVRERQQRNQAIPPGSAEVKSVPAGSTTNQASKTSTAATASSMGKRNGSALSSSPPRSTAHPRINSKTFLVTTSGSSSLSSSSSSSASSSTSSSPSSSPSAASILSSAQQPSLSGLSKYIPSPPSRIMIRRRASSNVLTHQSPKSNDGASSPNGNCMSAASLIMRGRNRSDPDLLSSAHSAGVFAGSATAPSSPMPSVSTPALSSSMPKSLAKTWTLSSPWNSPSKRSTKSK
ncbi:hypothetical protein BGZ81_003629 [Podila clonocystis]|nr:hypothetical protein BGZ81_003629 [Podila clonocystis]